MLLPPIETMLYIRVLLAASCMSYHERHAVALPERARSEEKVIVDLLTRELDERLMAHLPRAGHVETDIAHDRHTELLAHRERFVRHVK